MNRVFSLLFFLSLFAGICGFSFFPMHVFAQAEGADVTVTVSPEIPLPNQNVTIRLSSYIVNLEKATIYWKLDGQTKNTNVGAKSFSFMTGNIGTTSTVDITILVTGSKIEKRVLVQPAEIDMLWEAKDSHVPPFYKGKALPSSEAMIKITAVPNGGSKNIESKSLVYTWKRNFILDNNASGYGKSTYSFRASYLNTLEELSLDAGGVSQQYSASGKLSLSTGNPKILFYEDDPLLGTNYSTALNNGYTLQKEEGTIVAEPYFFSSNTKTLADLNFSWLINDNSIQTPIKKNTLTVRGAGGAGRAKIDLSIESIPRIFQTAKQYFFVSL